VRDILAFQPKHWRLEFGRIHADNYPGRVSARQGLRPAIYINTFPMGRPSWSHSWRLCWRFRLAFLCASSRTHACYPSTTRLSGEVITGGSRSLYRTADRAFKDRHSDSTCPCSALPVMTGCDPDHAPREETVRQGDIACHIDQALRPVAQTDRPRTVDPRCDWLWPTTMSSCIPYPACCRAQTGLGPEL